VKRSNWLTTSCGAALLLLATAGSAIACPMCKLANESNPRLPQAYMYSILFMMGMPATLTAGFGIGFYRLSRQAARTQQAASECEPSHE
jgi:hypothetical protein